MATTRIAFEKHTPYRYSATIERTDGVQVRLVAGGFNRIGASLPRIPHDIAHLLVEDAFAIDDGLWGVLAAGGLFPEPNTVVVGGKQRPHARTRGARIAATHEEGLRRAEVVVRAAADLALAGDDRDVAAFRRALGTRWALPTADADRLALACDRLRRGSARWDQVATGGRLALAWPVADADGW